MRAERTSLMDYGIFFKCFYHFFYCCTVHFDICRVHPPTKAVFSVKKHVKIYVKIHINIAPACFGLQSSLGSLH